MTPNEWLIDHYHLMFISSKVSGFGYSTACWVHAYAVFPRVTDQLNTRLRTIGVVRENALACPGPYILRCDFLGRGTHKAVC